MTTEIVGANFFRCTAPGSMGVVRDVIFRRCYWPRLDEPTAIFADGSSGIQVQGPPTPRNVVFPPDTVFLDQETWDGLRIPLSPRYFLVEQTTERRTVMRRVTREVQIDGRTVEATFDEPVETDEVAEITTELTEEQARDLAAGKTTREKLLSAKGRG